ncbi:MAG TPA: hypothetical protein VK447_12600 [Myxococcaceae bacterium]|nr:hypothetical protein [Myxococcaceae bacterium]
MPGRRASLTLLLAVVGLAGCSFPDLNDSQETASPTTPSRWRQAALEPAGDVDFYALQVTAGHTYRFTCVPESLGACRVELVNPEGAVGRLAEPPYVVEGKPGATVVTSALAGTDTPWYVAVSAAESGAARSRGTYRYRLEELGPDDHGDTLETATALNPAGEAGLGTAERPGDVDLFSFTAEEGAAYRFECHSATWRSSCPLQVLDARGRPAPDLKPWGFTVPAAGTWYVRRAEDSTGTDGPEAFWYALVRLPEDHGDTAETATPVPFPGVLEGELGADNPVDHFAFAGRAKQTFEVKGTTSCAVTYEIRDQAGRLVHTRVLSRDGGWHRYYHVRMNGRHVVRVEGRACSYRFSLETWGADEAGDTPQTAAPLGWGGLPGSITSPDDVDYFRLAMDAQRVYRIRCAGYEDWLWLGRCQVRFEAGTPVLATDDTIAPWDRLFRVKSKVDQPVNVRVDGNGNVFQYLLEVADLGTDDHGDTPETASALAPGAIVSGVHELMGDRDDFSATLEGGRSYTVSFQASGTQLVPNLYVYPPGSGTRVRVTPPYTFTAVSGVHTFEAESPAAALFGYVLRLDPG